ncbi:hypothetical protein [Fimbriimonas ginsengisoli]|uniref:Uncharacterized protein n=1 Tax=Fimbriimonas ginsengisoli Gsoil 348 TaxID=661478 RepID=A0A068NY47_FIMGI|nr:hypothetical protein [Fimbriimonas ginsengisoli]AIE87835.1 hypothetical protein OP10G_4467 [Fimbriimonas ginsengisoli Gsoil 348]
MTFGWEGFSFDHPDDWAPVVLTGNREQGYARLSSSGRIIIQIRWKRMKRPADAAGFLDTYLAKMERDARKGKGGFRSERSEDNGRLTYRYSGDNFGKGALFQPPDDGRAFVLEVASTKDDSLGPLLRQALGSFRTDPQVDRWSAFGLDVVLPKGLEVERKDFRAGKTLVSFKAKRVRLSAERWGFADQLLAKHGLEPWARAIFDAKGAAVTAEGDGIRLTIPTTPIRPGTEAIVRPQLERNQIVVIRSTTRDAKWRPQWDWLK